MVSACCTTSCAVDIGSLRLIHNKSRLELWVKGISNNESALSREYISATCEAHSSPARAFTVACACTCVCVLVCVCLSFVRACLCTCAFGWRFVCSRRFQEGSLLDGHAQAR